MRRGVLHELPQSRTRSGRRSRPEPSTCTTRPDRRGDTVAPSCRKIRAVERASSEVSAPRILLEPRARAASSRTRCVMLLSPGTRTSPATLTGRYPAESGGQFRRTEGERRAPPPKEAAAAPAARPGFVPKLRSLANDSAAEYPPTSLGCWRPAGWCLWPRSRMTPLPVHARRAPWPGRTPLPVADDWSTPAVGHALLDRSGLEMHSECAPKSRQ